MVRKYNPEVQTEYGRGMWDGCDSHDAVMKEGEHGKWVKLETFEHTTKNQASEIAKLKKHVATLQGQIAVLKGDVRVGPHSCAKCDGMNARAVTQFEAHKMICGFCGAEGPSVPLNSHNWEIEVLRMWNKRQERARRKQQLDNPTSYAQLMGDSETLPPGIGDDYVVRLK